MSALTKERSVARVTDRLPINHKARPDTDDVALCGALRPANRPIFYGHLSETPNPCVVCLDLKQAADVPRPKGAA